MKKKCFRNVRSDIWRIYGTDTFFRFLLAFATNRCFKPVFTLRMCQSLNRAPRPFRVVLLPFCVIVHHVTRHFAGIDLPWQTTLGAGLSIQHGWGAVINSKASIGNNVTFYHGVTIGQADRLDSDGRRSSGYPVIEDNVWIGPHAIIVGGITVGQGSRIVGGAFVAKSIPPFSLVSGNPAVVIRKISVPDVRNPYPLSRDFDAPSGADTHS